MFRVYSRHVKSGIVTYIGCFCTMAEAVSKIRQCYNIDVKFMQKTNTTISSNRTRGDKNGVPKKNV